jgi:hypothetical protein
MKITRKTKLKEIIDNEKLRTILEEFGFLFFLINCLIVGIFNY